MTPNAIIYGPQRYGGAGFFHLYDNQGYGQIKLFMKLWRSPTSQAGKLFRVAVSWAQHGGGTSETILQDIDSRCPHFEAKWLESLSQYLSDIGGQIRVQDTFVPKLQCRNDLFLTDVVLSNLPQSNVSIIVASTST